VNRHGVRKFIGIGGIPLLYGPQVHYKILQAQGIETKYNQKAKRPQKNVGLGQRVFHIRRILSTLHRRKVQERRWSMFLCPERERRVQSKGVGHGRCELLREPDRVVPCSAFGDKSGSEDTVGQQELHSMSHRSVESLFPQESQL
jgi:hypothetical protein